MLYLILIVVVIATGLFACQQQPRHDQLFAVQKTSSDDRYQRYIQPILNKRCVVCHGCYDAPCQLKLSSGEGLQRGANVDPVYDGTRLVAADPTRLFIDAQNVEGWREKDFFSVLDPASDTTQESSLMYQMLDLKSKHPLVSVVGDNQVIPHRLFDFSLNKTDSCTTADAFSQYADAHPLWGMPYGLPVLREEEAMILKYWLRAGAPVADRPQLDRRLFDEVSRWERFLNGDALKTRLVSRYLFEHLFLAHIYFPQTAEQKGEKREFFQLVRSTTPPGNPIDIIATRRPFDDPGVDRVYYRLMRVQDAITAKNHLPYLFDQARMDELNRLFYQAPFRVSRLPGYDPAQAANPFKTFAVIPARSRYRFMLQEARFTINGFMKGAVCRGQIALNVINDHFWVLFVDPDQKKLVQLDRFLTQHSDQLSLPAERQSNAGLLGFWTEYSELQAEYLEQKSQRLKELLADGQGVGLDWIWHGDGHNPNAALTVFRNFDSASVVTGLVGNPPKTAWLIDYPILERIHYLLVAGFDVYGNIGHQLSTRLYMDFLRMESEFNFLALLPEKTRIELREQWYQGASDSVKDYVYGRHAYLNVEPAINYPADRPAKAYLYSLLKKSLSGVLYGGHDLNHPGGMRSIAEQLQRLESIKGHQATLMPEMGVLMLEGDDHGLQLFTILRNSDHSHITSVLFEESNRRPQNDDLSVLSGLVGSYPDAIWYAKASSLPVFVDSVLKLETENDYADLMTRYGIRRSHRDFWLYSDRLLQAYYQSEPVESGLLDYNRLENR